MSLCCTVNAEAIETMTCDYDICNEDGYDCDDEVGPVEDDDDDSTIISKRSYETADGRTLWSYDSGYEHEIEARATKARPGEPRAMLVNLEKLVKTAIYKGKSFEVTSRPYWPGLASLKGDGSSTLVLKGGFR